MQNDPYCVTVTHFLGLDILETFFEKIFFKNGVVSCGYP